MTQPVHSGSNQESNNNLTARLHEYSELIKFEHTIFALPFALSAMILAVSPGEWPSFAAVLWVLLAMVGGRTYAMALNRLIDEKIDGANPRTKNRSIPAGRVKKSEARAMVLLSAVVLTAATFQLPLICRQLLPVAFVILTIYSYVKRFSSLAHLVLGVALGSSAVGGWLAVTGELTWLPVIFGFAVVFWVAGFDIIYACQDEAFDREAQLNSIPVKLGVKNALNLSRVFHVLTVLLLALFCYLYPHTGWGLIIASAITAGMLIYEHWIIRGQDGEAINLDRVNEAFFNINGRISVLIFALILIERLL